ncbi:flagellar biosynthetic protein FliR [Helicobacter enhydrae]|uniref:Flagellar biosynthetic protein FliR n=1 Tax=Helicobacter enhydrae TaxID=222136 RepID=A0A1B1U6P4_9HELI|nr:flagellar biosynthetic protein FliR [Helicobacter enhydrae]ANV98429.1 flagellar biosynthetic protein FliR [Helicobacter enhydrae]
MQLIEFLTQNNIAGFLLLLLRFSGLFAFFPFFDNQLIPASVRGALIFFCTILFFPLVPNMHYEITMVEFMIAGAMEILFGFCVGIVLQFVFASLTFGGDLMSFGMGLTMASAYDPVSGMQKPIVAQAIALLAMVIALSLDFHHSIFLLIAKSFQTLPLGTFALSDQIVEYCIKAFGSMMIIGFAMAFPVMGVLLLSDVIFGMIMKTNPQFNLLAIGFPIKIAIGLFVIMLVVPSIIWHFQDALVKALEFLKEIFWSV